MLRWSSEAAKNYNFAQNFKICRKYVVCLNPTNTKIMACAMQKKFAIPHLRGTYVGTHPRGDAGCQRGDSSYKNFNEAAGSVSTPLWFDERNRAQNEAFRNTLELAICWAARLKHIVYGCVAAWDKTHVYRRIWHMSNHVPRKLQQIEIKSPDEYLLPRKLLSNEV